MFWIRLTDDRSIMKERTWTVTKCNWKIYIKNILCHLFNSECVEVVDMLILLIFWQFIMNYVS